MHNGFSESLSCTLRCFYLGPDVIAWNEGGHFLMIFGVLLI